MLLAHLPVEHQFSKLMASETIRGIGARGCREFRLKGETIIQPEQILLGVLMNDKNFDSGIEPD
jgi:hypothetical protein